MTKTSLRSTHGVNCASKNSLDFHQMLMLFKWIKLNLSDFARAALVPVETH